MILGCSKPGENVSRPQAINRLTLYQTYPSKKYTNKIKKKTSIFFNTNFLRNL